MSGPPIRWSGSCAVTAKQRSAICPPPRGATPPPRRCMVGRPPGISTAGCAATSRASLKPPPPISPSRSAKRASRQASCSIARSPNWRPASCNRRSPISTRRLPYPIVRPGRTSFGPKCACARAIKPAPSRICKPASPPRRTMKSAGSARGIAQLATAPEKALADFQHALELNPQSLLAIKNIVHVSADRLSKPDEAFAAFEAWLKLEPKSAQRLSACAVLHARQGAEVSAVRDVEQSARQLARTSNSVPSRLRCRSRATPLAA